MGVNVKEARGFDDILCVTSWKRRQCSIRDSQRRVELLKSISFFVVHLESVFNFAPAPYRFLWSTKFVEIFCQIELSLH